MVIVYWWSIDSGQNFHCTHIKKIHIFGSIRVSMEWGICSFACLKVSPPSAAKSSRQIVYKYWHEAEQFILSFLLLFTYLWVVVSLSIAPTLVLVYYYRGFLFCSNIFVGSSCSRTYHWDRKSLTWSSELSQLSIRSHPFS